MASWDDVRRIATALPETVEDPSGRGAREWRVRTKLYAWDRPLGKRDRQQVGNAVPDGPILGARVPDLGAKEALIADDPDVYFTIPHFDGYSAILVLLDRIAPGELEEVLVEAWLARAPKRLADSYLTGAGGTGPRRRT